MVVGARPTKGRYQGLHAGSISVGAAVGGQAGGNGRDGRSRAVVGGELSNRGEGGCRL